MRHVAICVLLGLTGIAAPLWAQPVTAEGTVIPGPTSVDGSWPPADSAVVSDGAATATDGAVILPSSGAGTAVGTVIAPGGQLVAPGGRLIAPGGFFGAGLPADGPEWTFQADALWLQRTVGTDNFLGGVYHHHHLVDPLSSGDAGFSMQPGMRLQLTRRLDDEISWQGVYFGLQNWSTGRTVTADPINAHTLAFSPYTQTDAIIDGFGTSLGYTYGSRLQNAEFNRIRERGPLGDWRWRTLLGFRYFQWNDHFNLNGIDDFYPAYENLTVKSDNYLFGSQIGVQFERDWDRFHLQFSGKAGLLANVLHLHESNLNSSGYLYGSPPGFFPFAASATRGALAGVLDFSTIASYQLRPHFLIRGGYQLLFVPGVALAPAQMDGVVHQEGVFLHGPTAGFELCW
jgi:hypothetical protein